MFPWFLKAITNLSQSIELLIDLPEPGWYASDLHHHSDILDGVTPPELLVRSQLASGLDIVFVSDHDSIANNKQIGELSNPVTVLPSLFVIEGRKGIRCATINHIICLSVNIHLSF